MSALEFADSIKLAKCYGFQGDKSRAKAISKKLLTAHAGSEESEKVSAIYSTLASAKIEDSPHERVRLLKVAIRLPDQGPSTMAYLYDSLATAQLSLGNVAKAEEALEKVVIYGFPEVILQPVEAIRGTVLMNQGKFKEAASCFSDKPHFWANPKTSSINLAVCLEHLGNIRKAREIQATALEVAERSGSTFEQLVLAANLGAIETKLGNIGSAEALFAAARDKVRGLRRKFGDDALGSFVAPFVDMAALAIRKANLRMQRFT